MRCTTSVTIVRSGLLAGLVWLAVACTLFDKGDDDIDTPTACDTNAECPEGQVCAAGRCVAPGSVGIGGMCSANRDCSTGLHCSPVGVCAPAGVGDVGDPCATGGECARELVCELYGFGGTCVEAGTGDLGAPCQATRDCLAGLACGPAGTCVRAADAYPPFTGVSCPADETPFRVFFQVPRPGVVLTDFLRVPFPSDARIDADGTLNLTDFPRPGPGILGVDLVDLYADALAEDFDGFSPVGTVAFRFSKQFNFDTIGDNGANVNFVDVTDPDAPGFGGNRSRGFGYSTGRGKYACQHVFTVSPQRHEPLTPGGQYAVYLTSAIRSAAGEAPVQDPDLAAVLAPEAPSDPTLARVWAAHASFRTFMERNDLAPADIAAVAVFTVQDAPARMLALAGAVEATPLPTLRDLTVCDGATPSPCELAGDPTRVCGDSAGAFWELHGRMSIPNYQQGTLPYEFPPQGGHVQFDGGGAPVQAGTLDVCFALTVPKAVMPAGGWPLVVHAHGTGGHFRAAVTNGIAAELATAARPMATLTFDGVGHGERRGASTRDPDGLVFNVVNPRAARDNHLQGAVDVIQALRVAEVAPFSVGSVAVDFDPARTYYFGHSQGANVGIPAIAATGRARAVIFSGAGSYLTDGILTKTSPVNAKAALELLVGEPLAADHLVMTIWQTFFDRIDPVNFAPLVVARPPAGVPSKHVFLPWGQGDTYSPEATMNITARAMRLGLAQPVITPIGGLQTVARPVSLNRTAGDGQPRTAACFQYAPSGYDGHFVSTRHDGAVDDWSAFLVSHATTGTPAVP